MKHKVSELEGALLDAAVAKAEGRKFRIRDGRCEVLCPTDWGDEAFDSMTWVRDHRRVGLIIERENISILRPGALKVLARPPGGELGKWVARDCWVALVGAEEDVDGLRWDVLMEAADPLTAALRVFVASKLGEEVEL